MFQAASLTAIIPTATDVVCPSVCISSVTIVHRAKAVGRNEMPIAELLRPVLLSPPSHRSEWRR